MASSFITSILSPSPLKIVGKGFRQWDQLKVDSIEISVDSAMADIPFSTSNLTTEMQVTNSLMADLRSGKIIRPSKIKAKLICSDISTILGIISVFEDVTSTLDITSKEIMSYNMAMTDIELRQSPDKLSATDLMITFDQVPIRSGDNINPSQDGDRPSVGISVNGRTGLLTSATELYNKTLRAVGL